MRGAVTTIGQLILGKEESAAVRDRVVKGGGGLVGLKISLSALSFVVNWLLARFLGRQGLGIYSYALAWSVFLSIPSLLGMDQLLLRNAAVYHAQSQWGRLRGLFERANRAVLVTSAGAALLAGTTAWLLRGRMPPQALLTFWLGLLLVPLMTLTRVRQGAMQGLHRVALGAIPEQLLQPGLLLVLVAVTHLYLRQRFTAPVAMGLTVAACATAFLVGAQLLRRTLPLAVKEAAPIYEGRAWARSAGSLAFVASAGVLFAQADTLILGALKGTVAVGTYSVAHKGADLIGFALAAQNAAFASTVASLYATGHMERLQGLVTRLARWAMLGTAPLAILLIGFGQYFLRFYGPQFAQARLSLAILGVGQVINVALGSVGLLLTMTGHERQAVTATLAGAAVNIGLSFALVPHWGSEGAAVAYSGGMVVWNLWMAVALYRKVGLHSTALGRLGRAVE